MKEKIKQILINWDEANISSLTEEDIENLASYLVDKIKRL